MKIVPFKDLDKSFFEYEELEELSVVKEIVQEVRTKGDKAVRKYAKKFDNLDVSDLEVSKEEITRAYREVDEKTVMMLKKAAENLRLFATEQFKQFKNFETTIAGVTIGQRIVPLQRVGCYVPGGRYPLPSTALMCIIPAKVAGVREIVMCSPKIQPVTIVAADIAGVDRIFNIGGVQAIAALAFGTETVPAVDKIVGPGNKYVTAAKKEVYGSVGIDFMAGPSEVMIISDESGNPKYIAADLLAQAEHDLDAKPDLITTSVEVAGEVNRQLELQLGGLKTKEVAGQALRNGRIIIVKSLQEAVDLANKRAPEHIELFLKDPGKIIDALRNYGSLFIGQYSAEVFGDYCSGTNHVLPTTGASRYTGGLSVKDFVKILTYQQVDKDGVSELIDIATTLADVEGLDAHRMAAQMRR